MTVTSSTDILKTSMAWLIALLFPVLILLIDSNVSRSILFTFYPIALAMLVRTGPFWVDKVHILMASLLTGCLYVLINAVSPKSRDAFKDPSSDKIRSSFIFSGMVLGTVSILAISGIFSNLYRLNNFNS